MYYIVDTNILMSYPQIIQDKDHTIVIITDVLKELDGLKKSASDETAFKARRAAVLIARNIEDLNFNEKFEQEKISVDDKLIKATELYCNAYGLDKCVLITNDIYLKIKAKMYNLPTHGYGGVEEYTGIRTIQIVPDENGYHAELESLLNEHKLLDEQKPLKENEFIIVKDLTQPKKNRNGEDDFEVIYIGINKGGKIEQINTPKIFNDIIINNQWSGTIKPRNPEQICLCYALSNEDISIIYAGGGFGLGKTMLINNYALSRLERGEIRKIVYVPNNAFVANSMELGALPGTAFDKTLPLLGGLVDIVGIDEVTRMIQEETLEVVPIGYMRGRNFEDCLIIVNEAQNLDEDQVKLLIGRVGERSRILFDGSLKQVDSTIFRNKSGLKLLLTISNHPEYSKKFATVKLRTVERSKTAQIADYLDNLRGNI